MTDNVINIPKLFGENLQKLRKQSGFTQDQLSEKLEISQKHLSMLETGTQFASASLISKICETLNIEPAELFERGLSENQSTKLFAKIANAMELSLKRNRDIILDELKNESRLISNEIKNLR